MFYSFHCKNQFPQLFIPCMTNYFSSKLNVLEKTLHSLHIKEKIFKRKSNFRKFGTLIYHHGVELQWEKIYKFEWLVTEAKGYYFIRHSKALSSSSSTYPTPFKATSSICTQPLKNPMQTFWSNDCLKCQLTSKCGNAMGAYFISKASPPSPPFGSSLDLPLSTLPCTTKSEHLHLFFQLVSCFPLSTTPTLHCKD